MRKNGPQISLAITHAYIRSRLGYAGQHGKSLYWLACKALEKDGKRIPDRTDPKRWVIENYDHIRQQAFLRPNKTESTPPTNSEIAQQIRKAKHNRFTKDSFLVSYEWRELRMKVLKKYGAKCMCCGATPDTGAVMNVDHIKPRKTHPELALSFDNLQVLCHECNHGKGNWDTTDWRQ